MGMASKLAAFVGRLTSDSKVPAAALAAGAARANFGAGAVLQVVTNNYTTYTSGTNASYADVSGFSVSITPSSATSKILILYGINGITTATGSSTSYQGYYQLADASNTQLVQLFNGFLVGGAQTYGMQSLAGTFLHSPASTSALTYKIRAAGDGSSHGWQVNNYSGTPTSFSSITAMEIAA